MAGSSASTQMRRPALALATGLAIAVGLAPAAIGSGADSQAGSVDRVANAKKNPCLDPERRRQRRLLCPDLRMRPPFELERDIVGGAPVLRAANSIDSVGVGAVELRGVRSSRRTMNAEQRIHKRGPGHADFETGAELLFKPIPGQGAYWKFRHAAKFELWLLGRAGERKRLVEVGPKQVYCLRDLKHTHGGLARSPDDRVYPSCSQDPALERLTLGTSVGWSDVYSHDYHEQFIKIKHIPVRGCYAYVHVADPQNGIYELDERNNEASTVVYLTRGGDYVRGRCRGVEDKALPAAQTADDTEVAPANGGGGY